MDLFLSSVTSRGSHSSAAAAEGSNLQGCDSVLLGEEVQTFRRDVVSSSSRASVSELIEH